MGNKIHFNLALEKELLSSLKNEAKNSGESVSELMRWILKLWTSREIVSKNSSGNQQINNNSNKYNNEFCERVEKTLNDINSKLGNFLKHGKH